MGFELAQQGYFLVECTTRIRFSHSDAFLFVSSVVKVSNSTYHKGSTKKQKAEYAWKLYANMQISSVKTSSLNIT